MNPVLKKILKITAIVTGSLIGLLLLAIILIQVPVIQNYAKNQAINFLKDKTHTEIRLEQLQIVFPKKIVLKNLYIEDLQYDTLLYMEKLLVNISMFKLLSNTVEVNNLELENLRANVYRKLPDSNFNYSFLVNAFVSEQAEEPTTADATASLKFDLHDISLKNINIDYADGLSGNAAQVNIGEFITQFREFDFDKMLFGLKKIAMKNTAITYLQEEIQTTLLTNNDTLVMDAAQTETTLLPYVEIDGLVLQNILVDYADKIGKTSANVNLGRFNTENLKLNLNQNNYAMDKIQLHNSAIALNLFLSVDSVENTNDTLTVQETENASLKVSIGETDLQNNSIKYSNTAVKPVQNEQMDFNHLVIGKLRFNAKNIFYGNDSIHISVNEGSFTEQSGFALRQLKGDVRYSPQSIELNNLQIKTPNSAVSSDALIRFTELGDLSGHPERVTIDFMLQNSHMGIKDATYFVSSVDEYSDMVVFAEASAKGTLSDLEIPQLQLQTEQNTRLAMNGNIQGLPDMDNAHFDIKLAEFSTDRDELKRFLPDSLADVFTLPEQLRLSGFFKGSLKNFNSDLQLNTSMGNLALNATMLEKQENIPSYTIGASLNRFQLDKFMNDTTYGTLSMTLKAKGAGLSAPKANAEFEGVLLQADYNGYNYKNLSLNGKWSGQVLTANAAMADTNLNFTLTSTLSTATDTPAIKAVLDLKNIDLKRLHFYPEAFAASGKMDVDIPVADIDRPNGNIAISGLTLNTNGQHYQLDTIAVSVKSAENQSLIRLRSDFVNAKADGRFSLTKLGDAFLAQLNNCYYLAPVDSVINQQVDFAITIDYPKRFENLIPQLDSFSTARINGKLDTENDSLLLEAVFPKIIYADNVIDSIRFRASNAGKNRLTYNLIVDKFSNESLELYQTELEGLLADSQLTSTLFIRDKELKDKYTVGISFDQDNGNQRIHLLPNKLLLSYEKWNVSEDNSLIFTDSAFTAHNISISNGNQAIVVNSDENNPEEIINITFRDFQIETLTRFAKADSSLAEGIINGELVLSNLSADPVFETSLTVDKLALMQSPLGDLSIKVNNKLENTFEANVKLNGTHEMELSGMYYSAPKSRFDLLLDVEKIDLEEAAKLSFGQITNGTGILQGELDIKGNIDHPEVRGNLAFRNAAFNLAYLNSYFRLPEENIRFTQQGIAFDNFTLIDSLNHKAVVDGMVYTQNYSDYSFDLSIETDNFRAINTTAKDNDLFYGTLYLSSIINIGGDINLPEIDMNVQVNDKTDFTVVIPPEDPTVIAQEGVVRFVDKSTPDSLQNTTSSLDSIALSPFQGLNLSANIEIDSNAIFKVLVDPQNGDMLTVKGQAELNATIDPSGKISLAGVYELTDGSYSLSMGALIKKKFTLQAGSSITWTGSPMDANADLTATYIANTAAIDLVANQLQGLDQQEQNRYKQELPFRVHLHLQGELLKPDISFSIVLPDKYRNAYQGVETVYTRLSQVNNDENELNKQVFALLALNHFISNNPFESLVGGGGAAALARQSVSKLLTAQLNKLASDLVQGVNLSFDLQSNEDYSSGQQQYRTDLGVNLSKSLLNDRLVVNIGSSFGLEGSSQPKQRASTIAGDVSIDYKLSKDGRYRLRAYRKNQYEGIIEGEIIETGVGFMFVLDYEDFKEIFRKKQEQE